MRLTDEQIKRYQTLYKASFGQEISKDDALEQGLMLMRFVYQLTKPNNTKPRDENEYNTPKASSQILL